MNTWRKVGCCLVAVAGLAFGAWADAVTFTFSDFAATVEVPETCVTMPMRLELSWGEGGHAVLADPVPYSGGSFAFYPEQLGIANGTEITARLIAKYDLLDFIQSTGTQWLDTGTVITPTMSVEADYQLTTMSIQARVFSGGELNKGYLVFAVYVNGSGQWASASSINASGGWKASGVAADTNRHVHKLDNGTRYYYLDGKNKTEHSVSDKPTNNSLYFFADHRNPVENFAKAKLYSGTITDGGVVVRRFLPAQVDGEVGLVDFVKDEFLPGDGKDYSNYPLTAGTVTNTAGTVMSAATATCAWTPVDPQEPGHAVVSFGPPEVGTRHVSVPVKVYCNAQESVDFALSFGRAGGTFETVAITNGVRNGDVFVATLLGLSPWQEYTIRPVIANVTVEARDLVVNTLAYEEPPLGCPEITVEDDPNETESLTLTFAAPGSDVSLYCLTGVEDFGIDPSAWPTADKVADVAAGETSAVVSRPSGWGKTVGALRYYFSTTDDRSVAPKAMSRPSFYLASSAPSIVTIDSDVRWGDKAVLSGTFDGSADTLSVSYWKEGASVTQAVDGVLSGKTFSATIDPLEPGVVYGYRLLLAKGAATAQSTGTFTTPAAAGVTIAGTPSCANVQVTIGYFVAIQGAGDTFVWVEAKAVDGAYQTLSEPSVIAYGDAAAKSVTVISPWVDRTVDFRLAFSNACSRVENGSWLDTTDDVGVKVNDTTTYTFKPGGNGLYSAAENWAMNTTTGYGAPVSASATIVFPGGKTSALKVDGAYGFNMWDWSGAEKTVVLSGVVANASLSGNIKGGSMLGQTFKFSDMTMTEANGINIGGASEAKDWNASYSNLLWIASGAVLGVPRGNGGIYLIGSRFSEVRLSDDGRLAVDHIACVCGSEGLMFRLQGATPRIETADRIGPHPNQAKDCAHHPTTDGDVVFRYEVTSAGYAQAPVAIAGTKEADRFGRLFEGSTGRYVIEVADDSPAFAETCRQRVPLLTCAAGIETNNVAFAPPGARNKVEYYYQYGPEANLKEPQNPGDLPTGIWAKISTPSGLVIMVR